MDNLNPLFIRACQALFGETWQSSAARNLGISDRHVRRIAKGDAPAQPGMLMDLFRLAVERQMELDQIIEDIKVSAGRNDDTD